MNTKIEISDSDLPGLFQSADKTSNSEQKKFFISIGIYLILIILTSIIGFLISLDSQPYLKIFSAVIFFATLSITIWRKIQKPDNTWYNGRAVAESVKTRSWRFMMCAEPYFNDLQAYNIRKSFIDDLKTILKQNESLIKKIGTNTSLEDPITQKMDQIRNLSTSQRFEIYRDQRITNQALWYKKNTKKNKRFADVYFWIMVGLHLVVIILLLSTISNNDVILPIGVFAALASSILTWIQSKKYSELVSSYSLTTHEIILMKSEVIEILDGQEQDLSNYVMNCENAFSREHTQWFARKMD